MAWWDLYSFYLSIRDVCWPGKLLKIEEEIYTQEIIALGFLI